MSSEINWLNISFQDFERLTFCLVQAMGFDDPRLISGTGDLGQDIVAFQPANIPGIALRSREWVFQCKRVRSLRKLDITEELANFAGRKIDTWMLVTNCNPSPQFQRWFQTLSQSQRYPFHVEAWWGNDLEHFIRIHAKYLKDVLPDRILDCLKLTSGHQPSGGRYEAVLSRLRLVADSQIERFTRGKYIPKLYVRRKLEDDVKKFLLPDTQLAQAAKSSFMNMIELASTQIQNHPAVFDSRTADLKRDMNRLTRDLARDKNAGERPKLLAEWQSQLAYRKKIRDSANELISELLTRLNELLREAQSLPDAYLDNVPIFQEHIGNLISFIAFLEPKTRTITTATVDGYPPRIESMPPVEEAIAMLSDGGFIFSLKERLEIDLAKVSSLLKNTLLIIDRAGGGKTNLVCSLVQSLYLKQPVILFFGKENFDPMHGLEKATAAVIARCYGAFSGDVVSEFDKLLAKEDQHLTIFIDGINENRHIGDFDLSIQSLLEWSQHHRVRIIVTCRDIYWEFFNSVNWTPNIHKVIREELNRFAPTEYDFALPLYFDHYNINCTLAAEAKEACHHPLLLRFFCEAYGEIEGSPINLGEVSDMRLKELFDVYVRRKTEQIRMSLEHRNGDLVLRYLFSLVTFLFNNLTTVISTSELEDATGDHDTSTQMSLYLHLLDEDIIIEEEPARELHKRRVSFVYEEFMEYLLASSILLRPKYLRATNVSEIFAILDASLTKWVNTRGVGEYVALMLLSGEHGYSRDDAITFLSMMARSGKIWGEAFWSVISKCSASHLGPDLFDEFYFALDSLSRPQVIVKALTTMCRYDKTNCNRLASIILWCAGFPKVFTWTEFESLKQKNEEQLCELSEKLCSRIASREFSDAPGDLRNQEFLEAVIPFLDTGARKTVELALKQYQVDVGRFGPRTFLRLSTSFPRYTPFLINGLFSLDPGVRALCAYRLRFEKDCAKQVSSLCKQMASVETDPKLRRLLMQSAFFLHHKGRTKKLTPRISRRRTTPSKKRMKPVDNLPSID